MDNSAKVRLFTVFTVVSFFIQAGCTATYLRKHHGKQVAELTPLQYSQVLSNIAMFHCESNGLPHVAVLSTGTTQASDSANGTLTLNWNPTTLVSESLGTTTSRSLAESWNTTPVTNAGRLSRLQCAFKLMTRPQSVVFVQEDASTPEDSELGLMAANELIKPTGDSPRVTYKLAEEFAGSCSKCITELVEVGFLVSPDKGDEIKPGSLTFDRPELAQKYQEKLQRDIKCKLPCGWYHVSPLCDVPKAACYCGRYGKYVAWVDRDGVDALAKASISILDLAVREPSVSTVEFRKYILVDGEFVEVKGTASGSINDFVTEEERLQLANRTQGDKLSKVITEKTNQLKSLVQYETVISKTGEERIEMVVEDQPRFDRLQRELRILEAERARLAPAVGPPPSTNASPNILVTPGLLQPAPNP